MNKEKPEGNICCEGCYKIGLKEGREKVIEEVEKKFKEELDEDYYREVFQLLNKLKEKK